MHNIDVIIISLLTLVFIWWILIEFYEEELDNQLDILSSKYRLKENLFMNEFLDKDNGIYNHNYYPELRRLHFVLKNNIVKVQKESIDTLLNKPKTLQRRSENQWIGDAGDNYAKSLKNNDAWIHGWTNDDDWLNYPILYNGEFYKYALKSLPTLCLYLSEIKDCVHVAGLSVLRPHGKIRPHSDVDQTYVKGLLNYHFNIKCPDKDKKSILTINNKDIVQETGNSIMFDAGYLHSVDNKADDYRIILFLDFKHPKSRVHESK